MNDIEVHSLFSETKIRDKQYKVKKNEKTIEKCNEMR